MTSNYRGFFLFSADFFFLGRLVLFYEENISFRDGDSIDFFIKHDTKNNIIYYNYNIIIYDTKNKQ